MPGQVRATSKPLEQFLASHFFSLRNTRSTRKEVDLEGDEKVFRRSLTEIFPAFAISWPNPIVQPYACRLCVEARIRASYFCRAARCRSTCPALGTNHTSFGFLARSTSMRVSVGLVFLSFSPLIMNTGHSTFAM